MGATGQDVPRKIGEQMMRWNMQSRCWGNEAATQYALQQFQAQEYCKTLPSGVDADFSIPNGKPFLPAIRRTVPRPKKERQCGAGARSFEAVEQKQASGGRNRH